jgi:hypothetical protein
MNLFNSFEYVSSMPYFNHVLILGLFFIICGLSMAIILSYFLFKMLKISIDDNNIIFYNYNKKSKHLLDVYGDYKLTKLYLVRQPFSKIITFLLNIFSLYKFEKLINESRDNLPYHTFIIFEIKLPNNRRKLLLLEKNNYINISETFLVTHLQNIKPINLKGTNFTLNSVLNITQNRLGNKKYFNWHLYKNNCQEFVKQILITLNKYNKNKEKYVFSNKIMKTLVPTDFILHVYNIILSIINIFEKYIFDSNIFN